MKEITFKSARREEFHDIEAYLEQVANMLFGLFLMLSWWVIMTVTFTSGTAILAFITSDFNPYSQGELQEGLRVVVTWSGSVAAMACLLGNVGRFRDVFSTRARQKMDRYEAIKNETKLQIDITEGLLVSHGLITEVDVERRRADAETRTATVRGISPTT